MGIALTARDGEHSLQFYKTIYIQVGGAYC